MQSGIYRGHSGNSREILGLPPIPINIENFITGNSFYAWENDGIYISIQTRKRMRRKPVDIKYHYLHSFIKV